MRYVKDMSIPGSSVKSINGFGGLSGDERGQGDTLVSALNVSFNRYPSVCPRGRRAILGKYGDTSEIFIGEKLLRVENESLHIGDSVLFEGFFPSYPGGYKILRLGEYYVCMPQGLYCKTDDIAVNGFISNAVNFGTSGAEVSTLDESLKVITEYTVLATKPPAAEVGELWAKPKSDGGFEMKKFDGYEWRPVKTYVKIKGTSLVGKFIPGDVLECTGASDVFGAYIKVTHSDASGICFEGAAPHTDRVQSFKISRKAPHLQQATVSGGRVVGVYCGYDEGGAFISKAYASALNDPLCWSEYGGGLVADIGGDQPFTAIVSLGGDVFAFRESSVARLRINGDKITVSIIECEGVSADAGQSAVAVAGKIYYKGQGGVCVFDGSASKRLPHPFGKPLYDGEGMSPAAAFNGNYYVCLKDGTGKRLIYVYDVEKKTWSIEDDPGVMRFAYGDGVLIALCKEQDGTAVTVFDYGRADANTVTRLAKTGYPVIEENVKWSLESGEISADRKKGTVPVRIFLNARISAGASVSAGCIRAGRGVPDRIVTVGDRRDGYFEIPMLVTGDSVRLSVFGRGDAEILGYDVEYRQEKA